MGPKEDKMHTDDGGGTDSSVSDYSQKLDISHTSDCSTDKEEGVFLCRVCHCAESDRRGEAALGFLDIIPPSQDVPETNDEGNSSEKVHKEFGGKDGTDAKEAATGRNHRFIEFISPEGEVFVCSMDVESGPYVQQDNLIDLGCSCKNDLSLAHYACALKWFISHGSTICEICGSVAKNVRISDFRKIMASLKDYEALRERTATGELTYIQMESNSGVDPDAIAAIRRQRLSEISLWFNPQTSSIAIPQETVEHLHSNPTENVASMERPAAKWAVEGTVILVASGLLTLIIAWLIAPRVGKKTAKNGLLILLGGICALTVVIFLRFVVLSRIKYGPARYWAILFVFWFLLFGVWASRTHHIRAT